MKAIEYRLGDTFEVVYNSPRRDFLDMRTEFFDDARQISDMYGHVYIAFSGGVDSQIIARCFLDQNLPVTLVFLHVVGCNDVEYDQVRQCERYFGVDVQVIQLDIESMRVEWENLAKTEQFSSMHQYQFAWLSDQLAEDWPIVTQGSVEPAIVGFNRDNACIYHNYSEEMEYRFRIMGKHRTVLDFPFSPEAVASYYTDANMQAFCTTLQYYPVDPDNLTQRFNTHAKAIVKGAHFPDIIWFPKLSGYENHPEWITTKYDFSNKVSVPYWEMCDFMTNTRGSTHRFNDWHFKYATTPEI